MFLYRYLAFIQSPSQFSDNVFRPLQVSTIQTQCQVNAKTQSAALANIHLAVHFAGYRCSVTTMRHVHTIHWRNVSSILCQCRRQVHGRSSDRNTQHQTLNGCWVNVGPPSVTPVQPRSSIVPHSVSTNKELCRWRL